MNLKALKETFLNKSVQFIVIDHYGAVVESDDSLFTLTKGSSIEQLHPFFYSITGLIPTLEEKINFPCVNLDIKNKNKIIDVSIEKVNDILLLTFVDFSEHYTDSHPIVQEKNEASIQKNKLHFEYALLEVKENYKNEFISQVNHEIRNPLNNLLGFIDILKETKLDYQQQDTLGVIQKTGRHIKYLMDDLLDISKIETGSLKIKRIHFNLFHLIKNIETHFGLKGGKTQVNYSIETQKNIPSKLIGDPLRLNQILFNLIENAFKNTSKGTISVSFNYTLISKDKIQLHVKVSDTGKGIPEDEIEKVFDTYYRLKLDGITPIGQGLGLKIVKDLTDLLNGAINVTSKKNKGTQFDLMIPFELRSKSINTKTVPKGSGIVISKRVLVVDDEEINQMLYMKNFLNNDKGFHIEISSTKETTLERLEKKSYYAIIMKSKLNNESTIDLIKTIRNNAVKSIQETPILVVSGKTMLEQQENFLKQGATDFLAKPYTKKQLFKMLEFIQEEL